MFCPKCGAKIKGKFEYCPQCGCKLPEPEINIHKYWFIFAAFVWLSFAWIIPVYKANFYGRLLSVSLKDFYAGPLKTVGYIIGDGNSSSLSYIGLFYVLLNVASMLVSATTGVTGKFSKVTDEVCFTACFYNALSLFAMFTSLAILHVTPKVSITGLITFAINIVICIVLRSVVKKLIPKFNKQA